MQFSAAETEQQSAIRARLCLPFSKFLFAVAGDQATIGAYSFARLFVCDRKEEDNR